MKAEHPRVVCWCRVQNHPLHQQQRQFGRASLAPGELLPHTGSQKHNTLGTLRSLFCPGGCLSIPTLLWSPRPQPLLSLVPPPPTPTTALALLSSLPHPNPFPPKVDFQRPTQFRTETGSDPCCKYLAPWISTLSSVSSPNVIYRYISPSGVIYRYLSDMYMLHTVL